MPDWDDDSPRLRANLNAVFALIERSADARAPASLDDVRRWHLEMMKGLDVDPRSPDPEARGNFRGAQGIPALDFDVRVGSNLGTPYADVESETRLFERTLQRQIETLDALIPAGHQPRSDHQIEAVIEVAAWAHAEWVRIHPFANGNGRTARMWANWILIRYGMPPFVVLRPRPGGEYARAAAKAMLGLSKPTYDLFSTMYDEWVIKQHAPP